MKSLARRVAAGAATIVTVVTATLIASAAPASAAPALYLPFPAGTSYTVTQYPHTPDQYQQWAMDIGMPLNAPVLASAGGRVITAGSTNNYSPAVNGNQVIIDHGGNFCTQYNHLNRVDVSVGQQVSTGTRLGGAGMTGTATGVHLHWNTINCSGLTTMGPISTVEYPGGFRLGQVITSQNGNAPATYTPRLAVSDANGNIRVKEGNLNASWTDVASSLWSFSLAGDRIGVVSSAGVAQVKEGPLNAGWVTLDGQSRSIIVTPNRVGILRQNGELWVKEGSLNSGWVVVASDVSDFSLDGQRIGVVTAGVAKVKEGPLNMGWTELSDGDKIQVNGDRIGVLKADGTLMVKEGSTNAGWTTQLTGASQFHLSGSRIGAVVDGVAKTKDGDLLGGWVDQIAAAREIQVTQTRISVVGTDGRVFAKDGDPYGGWVELTDSTGSVRLAN